MAIVIQMRQIGFEQGWMEFIGKYVQPLQQRIFQGYTKVLINQIKFLFGKETLFSFQ